MLARFCVVAHRRSLPLAAVRELSYAAGVLSVAVSLAAFSLSLFCSLRCFVSAPSQVQPSFGAIETTQPLGVPLTKNLEQPDVDGTWMRFSSVGSPFFDLASLFDSAVKLIGHTTPVKPEAAGAVSSEHLRSAASTAPTGADDVRPLGRSFRCPPFSLSPVFLRARLT